MANTIELGVPRTGTLYDGIENNPETQALLELRPDGIRLTVSWPSPTSPSARWFLRIDDGTEVTVDGCPDRLIFVDSHGMVQLIQCQVRSLHLRLMGQGSGGVGSRFAVLDAAGDSDFGTIHGLRTHITGLRDWLGTTSWPETSGMGWQPPQFTMKPMGALQIGSVNEFTLTFEPEATYTRPAWTSTRIELIDDTHAQTLASEAMSWDAHLDLHMGVRDLILISRWWPESCTPQRAHRADDPERSHDGEIIGPSWRDVVTADEVAELPTHHRLHLIPFEELGIEGLHKWFELRDRYSRALDPLITHIGLGKLPPTTRLANLGPGVEALGYLLDLEDGTRATQAAKKSLRWRLGRILDDIGSVVPFDAEEWIDTTVKAYNGVKHANRAWPEVTDVAAALQQTVMAMRAWVALRLGIAADPLRAKLDSMYG